MKDKDSWFLKIWDEANPAVFGIGECSPLPKLSPDNFDELEVVLQNVVESLTGMHTYSDATIPSLVEQFIPAHFPAVTFALETALLDLLNGGRRIIYNNDFIKRVPIPINGLVWMGDMDLMLQQVSSRIEEGYRCIKIKVGGLNFEKECDILHYIRKKYYREEITIRLDANGSFKPGDAMAKLYELARYDIHSIEQPIKPGLEEMEALCRTSPIPIAFDEELIGVEEYTERKKLLQTRRPHYIILKPMLHGGFGGCSEWIEIAREQGIGFWMTSALESNIGLNAICQFTANYPVELPQGLGTGRIYENNVTGPLLSENGTIRHDPRTEWEVEEFLKE